MLTKIRSRRRLFAENLEARRLLAALVNGDFETGDLSGWTTFSTEGGSPGGRTPTDSTLTTPDVVLFDIDGGRDQNPTNTARFNVGQQGPYERGFDAGGGIFQQFDAAGEITVSAEIASHNNNQIGNFSGGEFSLLIDGNIVDSFDFGGIAAGSTEHATLEATVQVAPGTHEIRILMTRPYLRGNLKTPFQLVDNVVVESLNAPPVAADDSGVTDEDTPININVAANDTDPDGDLDSSTVTITASPANGSVSVAGDGTVTYTPDPDFHGTDSFEYEIQDSTGASDIARVDVTVNSVVDALVDVKPGNDENPINLKSHGVTPIAILSTSLGAGDADDFDASLVDLAVASFKINGEDVTPHKIKLEDVDNDGDLDLLMLVRTQDMALTQESSDIVLSAEFGAAAMGHDLSGSDSVKIVPDKGKKK